MSEYKTPNWLTLFIQLVRPLVLAAMFGLLLLGGLFFAAIELLFPGEGTKTMMIWVGFFAAINDEYYETLRFMFAAYVIGRSGQEIAAQITEQKRITADLVPSTTNVETMNVEAEQANVTTEEKG